MTKPGIRKLITLDRHVFGCIGHHFYLVWDHQNCSINACDMFFSIQCTHTGKSYPTTSPHEFPSIWEKPEVFQRASLLGSTGCSRMVARQGDSTQLSGSENLCPRKLFLRKESIDTTETRFFAEHVPPARTCVNKPNDITLIPIDYHEWDKPTHVFPFLPFHDVCVRCVLRLPAVGTVTVSPGRKRETWLVKGDKSWSS